MKTKPINTSEKPHPRWKPAVTVAAIIEDDGRFLVVQEQTSAGLRLNFPAGHLEPGESLLDACVREVLEETAFDFVPTQLVGVYLSQLMTDTEQLGTFLRFSFTGKLTKEYPEKVLDAGIVAKLWLTKQQLFQRQDEFRTPILVQNLTDYLAGQRFALDMLHTDASIWQKNENI